MTDADVFLERVNAHPDEDWPRLVYADWLDEQGDPRGRFIRVQCALARLAADDPRRFDLAQCEEALLDTHYPQWTESLRGLASGPEFRRGFVEVVNIEARVFLKRAEELYRLAPIRHVRLLDVGSSLTPVSQSPYLAKITGLTLFAQHLGDAVLLALADSPHLHSLNHLELGRNRISDLGLRTLSRTAQFTKLAALDLGDNQITDAGVQTLAASFGLESLHRIELRRNEIGPDGLDALAASSRLSHLNYLGLSHNRIGIARPFMPAQTGPNNNRLRYLDVRANAIHATTLSTITLSPHLAGLHLLDLGHNELGNAGATALAEAENLASLRVLYLNDNHLADEAIRALSQSPNLNYLTTLDISHNPMVSDYGARSLLEPRYLRSLRRLAPPGLGVTQSMRRSLQARYGLPLRRTT